MEHLACTKSRAQCRAGESREHRPAKSKLYPRLALLGAAAVLFAAGLIWRPWLQARAHLYLEQMVFLTAFGLVGAGIVGRAFVSLARRRMLEENVLMTLASAGAIALGELPEAVAIALFYHTGELFQDWAVDSSRRSISALMARRPDHANLLEGGEVSRVSPEQVRPGQLILVKPGERVPLDGVVVEGESLVDTSTLTGEPVPRRAEEGEEVPAGSVNGEGLLILRVVREYGASALARMLVLAREAAERKAPMEQFITRFARYYTPGVVSGAVALALVPPLLTGGADFSTWFYRALVLLVISCPCALVISIPLGYFGGIGCASRHGILIKGANYLEALLKVKTVLFDKTGTLTRGEFRVTERFPAAGFSPDELLNWAAHAGYHSGHPVSRSILKAYRGRVEPADLGPFSERRGLGVEAVVRGKRVLVGSAALMEKEGVDFTPVSREGSLAYVAVEGRFAGCLVIRDELKADAAAGVSGLRKRGIERVVLLTGDRAEAARAAAAGAGIDHWRAGLMPEDKLTLLEEYLEEGSGPRRERVAFVGDGVNDAAALMRADVGIAMGGIGSDAALEAADVVIMDDNLGRVAGALDIARYTRRIVVENIILTLGIKGAVVLLGILGWATIWGAVFADVGAALLAVLNATRVLSYRPPTLTGAN